MTNDWYYASHHQQKGPVTAAEMLALEQAGQLLPATLVWKWRSAPTPVKRGRCR
jgi:hypothetical protein